MEYFIIFLNLNVSVICPNVAQRDIKASSWSIFSYATSTWVHYSEKKWKEFGYVLLGSFGTRRADE